MVAGLPQSGDGSAAGVPAEAGDDLLLSEESEALVEASSEMRHMLVAAPQHPQQANPALSLTDLSGYSWVVYPTGTPMRTVLEREFGEAGLEFPRYPLETSSTFTMLSLLQEDPQLVAVMPHSIACSSESFGLLRRLPLELQARNEPCSIIHRRGSSLSPLASLLLEHLRSEQDALYEGT